MGASQSSEKVVYNETPIQFSSDLVNHLADSQASPETTPAQQSVLDAHVRARIQDEISRLRSEEDQVRREIELALERENIDKERIAAGGEENERRRESDRDSDSDGNGDEDRDELDGVFRSSDSLRADLEAIQKKADKYRGRSSLEDMLQVKQSQERLLECYRSNPTTSLNCWKEVADFKAAVQDAEQAYLTTL